MTELPRSTTTSAKPSGIDTSRITSKLHGYDATKEMLWPKSKHSKSIDASNTELLAKRQSTLLQILAEFSEQATLEGGLVAAANAIKSRLQCTRVSFGLCNRSGTRVAAISQQADVNIRTSETDLLAAVMQEVREKDELVVTTSLNIGKGALQAHRLLIAGKLDSQIVSIPVCHQGNCNAVLCIERESSINMSRLTLQLISNITEAMAPLIETRSLSERSLLAHAKDTIRHTLRWGIEPRQMKAKFGVVALVSLLLASVVVQIPHKIQATAQLVPLERRVIAAPRDGYIKSVTKDAGDIVKSGDILVVLDTGELEVEQSRWKNELATVSTESRAAMAASDRRKMAMLNTSTQKVSAQLDLVTSHLARSTVRAPVSGVIVSGDLSQMTGAPVERGQTLMELAPPEGYEVHLMVDETDITSIDVGHSGQLSLRALPGDPIHFSVTAIHPISVAENGANLFRIEANLQTAGVQLLPGQTGTGKVLVGEASILWIATHKFTNWFRHKFWEWLG